MMRTYTVQVNRLRKRLTYNPGASLSFSDFSQVGVGLSFLVRFYYCVLCFLFYVKADTLVAMGSVAPTAPIWPMELLYNSLCQGNGILFSSIFLPVSLLAMLCPWSFFIRFCSFFALFILVSYENSFGSLNHGLYFILYIAGLFLFLPNGSRSGRPLSRRDTLQALNVFWLVQFLFLFCYSMSGLWKLMGFGSELFVYDTLTNKTLARSIESDGRYIIWQGAAASYPALFQVFHVAIVLVQLSSLAVFFKPHLIRAYGALLIFFHFGTTYLLGITFSYHVFAWGIFFVLTPLAPKQSNIIFILYSIPLIGSVLQRLFPQYESSTITAESSRATIIYDGECPFCSNYVDFIRLRSTVGEVDLVNAREKNNEWVLEAQNRNLDLDEGMVFIIDDVFYYGSDAINLITLFSKNDSALCSLNHILFSNKKIAKYTYPIYKLGRRIILAVLRIPKIN